MDRWEPADRSDHGVPRIVNVCGDGSGVGMMTGSIVVAPDHTIAMPSASAAASATSRPAVTGTGPRPQAARRANAACIAKRELECMRHRPAQLRERLVSLLGFPHEVRPDLLQEVDDVLAALQAPLEVLGTQAAARRPDSTAPAAQPRQPEAVVVADHDLDVAAHGQAAGGVEVAGHVGRSTHTLGRARWHAGAPPRASAPSTPRPPTRARDRA